MRLYTTFFPLCSLGLCQNRGFHCENPVFLHRNRCGPYDQRPMCLCSDGASKYTPLPAQPEPQTTRLKPKTQALWNAEPKPCRSKLVEQLQAAIGRRSQDSSEPCKFTSSFLGAMQYPLYLARVQGWHRISRSSSGLDYVLCVEHSFKSQSSKVSKPETRKPQITKKTHP